MPHILHPPRKRQLPPYIWSFSTYFAEGFPYTIIRTVSSVFFRDRGMSLQAIGLTSLFGLPWILKFLWSPQVDEYGTKRSWLLVTQGLLVLALLAVALLAPFDRAPYYIAALFFVAAFLAATHDIAIDGYYMEALDERGQARFVGYRVMAYRIAMMAGTGVITTIGTTRGWPVAFAGAALLFLLLFLFHCFRLPECQSPGKSFSALAERYSHLRYLRWPFLIAVLVLALRIFTESSFYRQSASFLPLLRKMHFAEWVGVLLLLSLIVLAACRQRIKGALYRDQESFYARAFLSYMDREKIPVIIAFIIFIRTGEFMLTAMVSPFMVDLGIKVHYGWISGGIGLPSSIVGAILGGWLISRYSLHKMIWPFLLAQNITNLVYMALALHLQHYLSINTGIAIPTPIGNANIALVAAVHAFDQFSGGLGTAVLMTFLMGLCRPSYKAAHYAIGTGLMSVSGLYAGVLSGFLTSWIGYGYFFGMSFLFSIPGMALIPFLPLAGKQAAAP